MCLRSLWKAGEVHELFLREQKFTGNKSMKLEQTEVHFLCVWACCFKSILPVTFHLSCALSGKTLIGPQ